MSNYRHNAQLISSDLKRLESIADAEIDYSDSLPLDDTFFTKSTVVLSQKTGNTIKTAE